MPLFSFVLESFYTAYYAYYSNYIKDINVPGTDLTFIIIKIINILVMVANPQ